MLCEEIHVLGLIFVLGKAPTLKRGMEAFYPFAEFQARKGQPMLPFSPFLLVSDNFFRPSWISTGDRRLKNITFVLEWIPNIPTGTRPVSSPHIPILSVGYFSFLLWNFFSTNNECPPGLCLEVVPTS